MNIPTTCKAISENLAHNLRLAATEDERQQYRSLTLQGIGDKLIPALNRLLAEKGEGDPELEEARTAALELATFVCIDYIRKCTDFRGGISCLEELTANCREPQLKRKLVLYTNQLKKRWNGVEPGGIAHTPRAKRHRPLSSGSKTLEKVLGITLLFVCVFSLFTYMDITTMIFPRWNEQPQPVPAKQLRVQRQQEFAPRDNQPQPQTDTQALLPEPATGSFYSYTDEKEIVHIVDDLNKVPRHYRKSMTVTGSGTSRSNVTTVIIRGDQVIVPVTMSFRGRSVDTCLLLDTGASMTTISGRVASFLGIEASDVKAGRSTVADGRSVGSCSFVTDSIAVGSRRLSSVQASILPGSGGEGYDGLLGMNFLKNFRYHVDFNRSVIEWGT
jgi:predicted aspartyl protease